MAVSQKLIDRMNDLVMLDHDAVEAYQQAIDRIDNAEAKTNLTKFQADHKRHIQDLSRLIGAYGGKAKERGDAKGFFIKGMTALRSMAGDEQALKAMRSNEKLTNEKYQEALDARDLPEDVRLVFQRNRDDEARHLSWIERAIDERIWEKDTGASV